MFQMLRYVRSPWRFLDSCRAKFGNVFSVDLGLSPFSPMVVLGDPAVVNAIHALSDTQLEVKETNGSLNLYYAGKGVIMSDGASHTRKRKLLMPAFHGAQLVSQADVMLRLANQAIDALPHATTFAMRELASTITFNIIAHTVFGMTDTGAVSQFSIAVQQMISRSANLLAYPFLQVNAGPWSPMGRFLASRTHVESLIMSQVTRRRAEGVPGQPRDLLDLLLATRDEAGEALGDDELRTELLTLLIAGYETTSLALTWLFRELLKAPEIQERIRAEVREATGGGALKGEHFSKLVFTRACFLEALRLYPLFLMHGRKLLAPVSAGGVELPAGTVVVVSPWLVHRDPSSWPDPERFQPERHLSGTPPKGTFFPFGGGVRRCVGAEFALLEATLATAAMVSRMELTSARDHDPMIPYGLEIVPKYGTQMRATPRAA